MPNFEITHELHRLPNGQIFLDQTFSLASIPNGNVEWHLTHRVVSADKMQYAIITLKSYDTSIVQINLYDGYGIIVPTDTGYFEDNKLSATTAKHIAAFGREFLPMTPFLSWFKSMLNGDIEEIYFFDPEILRFAIAQAKAYENGYATEVNAMSGKLLSYDWNTDLYEDDEHDTTVFLGTMSVEDYNTHIELITKRTLLEVLLKGLNGDDDEDEPTEFEA